MDLNWSMMESEYFLGEIVMDLSEGFARIE